MHISTLAKKIKAEFPLYEVEVNNSTYQMSEGGKEYSGYELIVYNENKEVIFNFNGADPYKKNSSVLEWIDKEKSIYHKKSKIRVSELEEDELIKYKIGCACCGNILTCASCGESLVVLLNKDEDIDKFKRIFSNLHADC